MKTPDKTYKRIILSTILFVIITVSCQSKKQIVKTETEIKTVSELSTNKEEATKTDTQTLLTIARSVSETDSTIIEETITELSKPDSTGNQHPEKITTRKISSGKNKETKVVESSEVNLADEKKVTEIKNLTTNQEINNETASKTKIKKLVPWKIVVAIIFLAGIVFVLLKFKNKLFGF